MTTTFFTADTHFSHQLVAGLRGFSCIEEHNEFLVASWNAVVTPQDTVWHLGDVTLKPLARVAPYVARLNGTIHLVTGNHDECHPQHRSAHKVQRAWLDLFASVQTCARRRIEGHEVLLSHYPYRGDHTHEDRFNQYRLPDLGSWLLHGHTHATDQVSGDRQIHVGLDAWDLRPVSQGEISKIITHVHDRGDVMSMHNSMRSRDARTRWA